MTESYTMLLRTPQVPAVLGAGALARLPVGMYGLGLLFLAHETTGSLGAAGAVGAAAGAGYAVVGPAFGRAADRHGPVRPLLAATAINACAFGVCLTVAALTPSVWMLGAAAFLVGASIPPVASCQRALWPKLLDEQRRETALALDSLQLDAFLILGPLLVTALSAVAGPAVAVGVTAVLIAVGTVVFAALPACRTARPAGTKRGLGPLRSPGFLLLLATIAATGAALGVVRVSLIGFADAFGDASWGGVLYTAIGIGSALGGLWYGSRSWSAPVERRYVVLLALYGACVLPLLAGTGTAVMFGLAILTGIALTPATIGEFALIGRCAPAATVTEAFAWATTATFAGNAAGTGAGGWLVQHVHWRAGIAVAATLLLIAAVAALWRIDLLRPRTPLPS
ncbi:MFS transporter [Streptomyces sp. NPDC059578]|uniref:MFS transporter n=1 Tax=unclassified Streptomyces TaxID=2593676 RepID=UPI0036635F54